MSEIAIAGVEEPEGPVCLEDGGFYIVEMSCGRHCVAHGAADGTARDVVATAGRPNGLAVGGDAHIRIAEGALVCVAETLSGDIFAHDLAEASSRRQRFGNPTQGPHSSNSAFRRRGSEAIVTEVSAGQVQRLAMPCASLSLFYPSGLVN